MSEKKATGAIKKKRDHKKSKKDSTSWENVIKEIEELDESEKWVAMESKYRELHENYLSTFETLSVLQKKYNDLELEKNHLSRDMTKVIMNKTQMESVARELQKQNKELKEKYHNKLREEEERRKVMATTFTEKLNKLNVLMDENRENSGRLKDENLNMRVKLKELYDQFQEREQHMLDMNKQIDLQHQLSHTQLKKLDLEFATEREIWAKEKSVLLSRCERTEKTNLFLEENVKSLQSHLEAYQKQFTEFENTIKQSNTMYASFKEDMVKLQKTNRELDKDRKQWKARSQSQLETILRMTEANETVKQENLNIEKKRLALEKLCRQLQQERIEYIKKMKELNVSLTPEGSAEASDNNTNSPRSVSPESNENPKMNNQHDVNIQDAVSQTDFPSILCHLPICPPNEPDNRFYLDLEEGKLMRFKVDIRPVHNHYVDMIENVVKCSSSTDNDKTIDKNEAILNRLRNMEPEDIVLDFGVLADRKITAVANLGDLNVNKLGDDLMKDLNIGEDEKQVLPKIRIKPIETMLAKPESNDLE